MLEIIVIILVVKMFSRKAVEKGFNKILWGFIGAFSYYGPILIMRVLILPELILNGTIPVHSEMQITLLVIGINLVTGVTCCFITYQILKRFKPVNQPDNILDNNIN